MGVPGAFGRADEALGGVGVSLSIKVAAASGDSHQCGVAASKPRKKIKLNG